MDGIKTLEELTQSPAVRLAGLYVFNLVITTALKIGARYKRRSKPSHLCYNPSRLGRFYDSVAYSFKEMFRISEFKAEEKSPFIYAFGLEVLEIIAYSYLKSPQ